MLWPSELKTGYGWAKAIGLEGCWGLEGRQKHVFVGGGSWQGCLGLGVGKRGSVKRYFLGRRWGFGKVMIWKVGKDLEGKQSGAQAAPWLPSSFLTLT